MGDSPFGRLGLALALAFCTLPAFSVAGGLALAPAVGLAGALAFPLALPPGVRAGALLVGAPLLGIAGWAALSTAWSPAGAALAGQAFDFGEGPGWMPVKLALAFATGLAFVAAAAAAGPRTRRFGRGLVIASVFVLIAIAAIEALGDMPLNRSAQPNAETGALMRNPGKGVSVLIAVVFGVFGACWGRGGPWRAAWVIAALGALWLATRFGMDANWTALCLGLAASAATFAAPRLVPLALGAGVACWALAAPFAAPALLGIPGLAEALPDSWAMRLGIWNYAAESALARPWLGHGLDASRLVRDTVEVAGHRVFGIPLHPHSLSLHVWYELGAVGAALLAAAAAAIGVVLSRLEHRAAAAAGAGAFITVAAIWNVSYGAWQEWWIAAAFLAAAAIAVGRRAEG